ncbi:MAG: omptin family outer membrane protease [Treponema sp.]|jgi:outer membrane protease|nr:omptin family outer membrane protease [Treponema sp.]
MRNIPAFALLVIIFFTPGAPVSGQSSGGQSSGREREYVFSIAPRFGLLYGHAEEIVYPTNTKGTYLSQLLWNMKPLFYYGFTADIARGDTMEKWGWFSGLSCKFGIPQISGIHENRDWMSYVDSDLTHFSSHDNLTRELFFFDFSAGLSFPVKKLLWVKAFGNVSYGHFSFSGLDGYGRYARIRNGDYDSINNSPQEYDYSGKVINYTQEWIILSPGFSAGARFLKNFSFEFSFLISPFIYCADLDEHLTTGTQYRDYMGWGLYLEPRVLLSWAPLAWLDVSLETGWRYISGTRGETYSRPLGKGNYAGGSSEAGAGLSLLDAGLFFKFRL